MADRRKSIEEWKKLENQQHWIFDPFDAKSQEKIEKPNLQRDAFKSIKAALNKKKDEEDDNE